MHYDTVIMTLVEHNYIAYLGGMTTFTILRTRVNDEL